jgi:hypothetical protein
MNLQRIGAASGTEQRCCEQLNFRLFCSPHFLLSLHLDPLFISFNLLLSYSLTSILQSSLSASFIHNVAMI